MGKRRLPVMAKPIRSDLRPGLSELSGWAPIHSELIVTVSKADGWAGQCASSNAAIRYAAPMAKRVRSPIKPRHPKVRRPPRTQLLADPVVAEITHHILAYMAQGGDADVRSRVEVGAQLRKARDHIPHGKWLRWLEHHLPFSQRTAERAIVLHAYAEKKPVLFERVAPLGIGRAYLLLSLHGAVAEQILATKHIMPNTGAKKSVEEMSFPELLQVWL